jgi:hypothetical protein
MGMTRKNLDQPDETRPFGRGKLELASLGNVICGRATFEPGWRWSENVKPIARTESCQVHHTGYVISGRMKIVMDDGSATEIGPGDAMDCPPGHDAWVVGDEACVIVEIGPASNYAKPA